MTARVVGWVPNVGRLSATVSAVARLGATPDNEVVVRVDGVSRTHAKVIEQPDGFWLEDAGSRNGTWLNGERITRAKLRHLDVITLGRFAELVFVERAGEVPEPVLETAPEGLRARLEWLDGPEKGSIIDLPLGEIIIGRAESCGIVVDSDAVSRAHVRLTITDEGVTIEDLGTVNGTAVNGRPLSRAMTLDARAEVDVGQARRFRLLLDGSPAKSSGTAPEGTTPIGSQDMDWMTRLVWSASDLEALRAAQGSPKAAVAPATPQPVAPLAAPPRTPPPAPPLAPAAQAPAAEQTPAKETLLAKPVPAPSQQTQLATPTLGNLPSAIKAPADDGEGRTRYDPAASVKVPKFGAPPPFQPPADPGDVATSLGEPPSRLDPPSALDAGPGADDAATSLPGVPFATQGGRTQVGGSPFDLPAAEPADPTEAPTSLGTQPGTAPATTGPMPSNFWNPRDRTNLPPETVLGFRDVGPGGRGTPSSGGTQLMSGRTPQALPTVISPSSPAPESPSMIESVKMSGDHGIYVIPRGTATIGRSSEATIRIDSREMSRIHAVLTVTDSDVIVEDRGSINGTSVNGTTITGRRSLVHGDRVCFADFEFRLEVKRTEGHS